MYGDGQRRRRAFRHSHLGFSREKTTLGALADAVRSNFAGNEKLRQEILALPRFGVGGLGDEMARQVAELLADRIVSHGHDNMHFLPSLHTLDANVHDGAWWDAGFDGRLAGAPFAKNAGPADEARGGNPTTVILSCAPLPQTRFSGGQPLDLSFSPAMIHYHKEKIAALIRMYLENGGLQLQVNGVSVDVLRDVLAHPEPHEDLVVRIGGYSQYFNRCSYNTKLDFIRRFERECGNG